MKKKPDRRKETPALFTRRLLTPQELAEALSVPIFTVRTLYRSGRIPVVRVGYRTLRFDLEPVLAALNTPEPKSK